MTREEFEQYAKENGLVVWSKEMSEKAIKALEQEPFINKLCVSSGVCEHDKQKVLDKIRAEIEELRYGQPFRKFVVDECLEIIDKYKAESEG